MFDGVVVVVVVVVVGTSGLMALLLVGWIVVLGTTTTTTGTIPKRNLAIAKPKMARFLTAWNLISLQPVTPLLTRQTL